MGPGPFPLRTVVVADSVLAQPTFEALLRNGLVAGLCTTRSPTSGAGLRHHARAAGVPVFEADRDAVAHELVAWVGGLKPDVLLSFAFPYLLPAPVLGVARLGAFNVHGGRLPEYRGPQPIFWQIARREPEGAVTLHRMDEALDRGPIVASCRVPIGPDDTFGLHAVRLAFAAVPLAEALFAGLMHFGADLPATPQDERLACCYRRPVPADLAIRWETQSGEEIRALVKAGNPWNKGAFTSLRGLELRLTDVRLQPAGGDRATPAGTILSADPATGVVVNCRDGSALVLDVVSMEEGLLAGRTLVAYGIGAGERFLSIGGGAT
jgi:methionyl-tRNA formyltransferase